MIKIPCFYLHAWDDIILGPKCIPDQEFYEVENIILATTKVGGHCCHFENGKLNFLPDHWF